jgi:hypothetical protein
MMFAQLFAQGSPAPADWGSMLVQGGVGAIALFMLRWFMTKNDSALKANTNAVDRMARANLILVLSLKQADASAKEQARDLIKEIDDAAKVRSDGQT